MGGALLPPVIHFRHDTFLHLAHLIPTSKCVRETLELASNLNV